jgi:hypothetical protein
MDLKTARIGGETLPDPLLSCPFDTISFSNIMERE